MKDYAERKGLDMPKKHNTAEEHEFFMKHHNELEYLDHIMDQPEMKWKENQEIASIIRSLLYPDPIYRFTLQAADRKGIHQGMHRASTSNPVL